MADRPNLIPVDVFSLNVPLPPAVDRLAAELHPSLIGFDRIRDRRTLVLKRFGDDAIDISSCERYSKDVALATLRTDLRPHLAGVRPFDVSVVGIDVFEHPASGPGPVVYLAVASPALIQLHTRLCTTFEPVPGIEGDDYKPHVTLARGGSPALVDAVLNTTVDPFEWRVHELLIFDAEFREVAGRIRL